MEDKFNQLVRQYEPLILGTMRKLHVYKHYDDYYQVGLIALWEAYLKFDPEKGFFASYAQKMVRGRMLSALQKAITYEKRHVFPNIHSEENDFFAMLVEESTPCFLEHDELAPYFEGLSKRERLWVEKAFFQGMKPAEIAEEEGVSPHTVRGWKKGALKKIRSNAEIS